MKAFGREKDDYRLLDKAAKTADAKQVDHGLILGLADDDHPQYHDNTRGDIRYYTQAQVATLVADAVAALLAEASADATVTVSGTAGATYTSTEQDMINALKADVIILQNSLNDLKAKMRTAETLDT